MTNQEKKAGCYSLQADGLCEHQGESDHRVLDPILTKKRAEPAAQKMENEEEIERDKEAVDYQLEKKIRQGAFSRAFHTLSVRIGNGLCGWIVRRAYA